MSILAFSGGARAVRIPEHTCHKLVNLTKCDLQSCTQECSKEAHGNGVCKDNTLCFCTYYCKDPPV
ncbi:S locus-related glycoprotein 1 binding pollen coat protein [Parasponia andersonii]|uniref:S locus-related glycoprotein 1 binding pollen coat protein n=1 Tax=Parasponia andersonii TaxID=3476 RepID=A0A2P5DSC9_PARAD|nr:S locus-related glycoprotein 1 binding pollen coat protein [Parasponia andersonii]